MALELRTTTAFERDLRRVSKQGKDLHKLAPIVNILQAQEHLPARCRPHPLRGNWTGHWDCHVEPDSMLLQKLHRSCPREEQSKFLPLRIAGCRAVSALYKLTDKALILVRTGSHADLFGL